MGVLGPDGSVFIKMVKVLKTMLEHCLQVFSANTIRLLSSTRARCTEEVPDNKVEKCNFIVLLSFSSMYVLPFERR